MINQRFQEFIGTAFDKEHIFNSNYFKGKKIPKL